MTCLRVRFTLTGRATVACLTPFVPEALIMTGMPFLPWPPGPLARG